MDVSLTPELQELIDARVRSGRFNSPAEVLRVALHLLEQREQLRDTQLRDLQARIDQGLAELDRGEGVDGETFMQAMLDDLDRAETERKAG